MYKILIVFVFSILLNISEIKAQTINARYSVTTEIVGAGPLADKLIATTQSTGYFFRDKGRYLYYEKPDYLNKYPDGRITVRIDESNSYGQSLCLDSIQFISYTNTDSLVRVYRPHVTGKHGALPNYRQQYEADYFTWVTLPETKVINGLKCQKATMSIRNNLQWIVWFTPQINTQSGIKGIIGVPGLVVEAECPPLHTKYSLIEFSESVPVKSSVFELAELKERYETMPPLLKTNIQPAGKSKIQKQAELTNQ